MKDFYQEQTGILGRNLEMYIFNDVGKDMVNIPAPELINSDQDEKSIITIERFV
jgi:hypothetical protein